MLECASPFSLAIHKKPNIKISFDILSGKNLSINFKTSNLSNENTHKYYCIIKDITDPKASNVVKTISVNKSSNFILFQDHSIFSKTINQYSSNSLLRIFIHTYLQSGRLTVESNQDILSKDQFFVEVEGPNECKMNWRFFDSNLTKSLIYKYMIQGDFEVRQAGNYFVTILDSKKQKLCERIKLEFK